MAYSRMKIRRLQARFLLAATVPTALFGSAIGIYAAVVADTSLVLATAALLPVALAGSVAWAYRLGHGVGNTLEQLVSATSGLRSGHFEPPSHPCRDVEIERLTGALASLSQHIEYTQGQLHERIATATHELQETLAALEARNEEVETARSEAEAASAFKSRFLTNISHEIRTPMNSILGFIELMDENELNPVQIDYLTTIRSSALSLLSLLNGILDLSKIESGRMELEYADTDINAVLFETYHLFAPQAFGKGIELTVSPARKADARVRIDSTRLKQVLINLVSNAVKFTDTGHVRLAADTVARADGSVGITFSCGDTGRGIPHAAQAHLFRAFAQGEPIGDEPRLRPADTGLGLHIASEIVFLMEGVIEFRSEPGVGSEFWFSLELERAHRHPDASATSDPVRRVVLLEPDGTVADAHCALLENAGIEPLRVTDAASASQAISDADAREQSFAAVLIHVGAEQLHSHDVSAPPPELLDRGIPVLAYTYAQCMRRRRFLLQTGFSEVLDQTPEPTHLRTALESILLPAHTAPAEDDGGHVHATAGVNDAAHEILIVDDQPLNLKLFEHYLLASPYAPLPAQSSDEALYQAGLRPFAAILLDIHLPERDGLETARLLRAPECINANTPIIAVTADAFVERSRAAVAAGMNDVLVKPVGRQQLLECLNRWCTDQEPSSHTTLAEHVGPQDTSRRDSQAPLYDPHDGRDRAGGRDDVAHDLFVMLQRHVPESLEELEAAHSASDWQELHAAAHRLKGAAAYCGVPRLRGNIEQLERRIAAGSDVELAFFELTDTLKALQRLEADAS